MLKLKFSFFILIFAINHVLAQQYTVSGYVTDCKTGEKLIGVNIKDLLSGKACASNNFGYYSLQINSNRETKLQISYIGYSKKELVLNVNSNQKLNIKLCVEDKNIEEVDVIANRFANNHEVGIVNIPMKDIKVLPAIFGETDVLRAYMLMPGVQGGKEGSSELYVRGGSPDQNLIILDDIPLYYINHIGGFVSIFDDNSIKNIKLIKGGFPARYGGRLSGITDIRMKDGNLHNIHGNFTIGIVSSKIMLEGPIKKEKASFLISARRSLFDLFIRPISLLASKGEIQSGYTFYDINAKTQYIINDKNRLFFSFYLGNDKIFMTFKDRDSEKKYTGNNKIVWGNILSALRWNHEFSSKLFSNTSLAYTKFSYNTDFIYLSEYLDGEKDSKFANNYISNISDMILKSDFDYFVNDNHHIKFGIDLTYHTYIPGVAAFEKKYGANQSIDTTIGSQLINSVESSVYLEDEFKIGQKFITNIGFRYTNFWIEGEMFQAYQPRIVADYRIIPSLSIKASYAQMTQNIHLLTNSSASQPTDLWVPATPKLKPENSFQYTFGVSSLIKNKYEFSIESFYKTMDNLIEYKEGASFFSSSKDWQEKVEKNGTGEVYGVETLIKKSTGNLKGWIAYTWSKNMRQFAKLNFGEPYPYKYDRRHDLSLVLIYQFRKNISFSANWVYTSGYHLTLAVGKYNQVQDGYDQTIHIPENTAIPIMYLYNYGYWGEYSPAYIYNGKNNYQTNSYHRLDLSVTFTKQKKRGVRELAVSIYNVYNHLNPYYVYYKYEKSQLNLFQYSLFPFMPSISYSFKF
jgi:hypothetical protein